MDFDFKKAFLSGEKALHRDKRCFNFLWAVIWG